MSDSEPTSPVKSSTRKILAVLGRYFAPQWRPSVLLLLLLLTGIGLQLINPWILSQFIDQAVAGAPLNTLLKLAGAFLLFALLRQLDTVAESYLAANIGLRATNQLRSDLARHCLNLDMAFHNARTPGEMIERIDGDVDRLNNFFARFVIDLLGNLLLLIGVLILVWRIHWQVGAALTGFSLATFILLNRLRDIGVPLYREARQANAMLYGFIEERLAGTEDIRANGGVAYVMRRLLEHARRLFRADLKANLMSVSVFGFTRALFMAGTGVALGLSAFLYLDGILTIGAVYLSYRYTEVLLQPIEVINRQIQDLQQAGASVARVQDLLARTSRIQDTGTTPLPQNGALPVQFEDLTFGYIDDDNATGAPLELVLRGLSFTLPAGSVTGLLGRTGSGKTTLSRMVFRAYDPTGGAVRLGGLDLRAAPLADVRRAVGVVTQEIQLFHASLRDNLTLFDPAVPDAQIESVIRELGLGDWLDDLPDGLNTLLQPGGGGLSAGEAQLLAFVRVFLSDPQVVVLDEASSRLDPATERLLEQAITRLLTGRTGIVIAHRLGTIERVDNVIILERGQVLEFGARAALASDSSSRFSQLLATGLEEALV
ncbi:MAG: ABC transporter ATP-binding protein [Anaerolineae bacterium]|nr:MAG: ABC transporter ATP-binding protein [Anaerolineae bacterium]